MAAPEKPTPRDQGTVLHLLIIACDAAISSRNPGEPDLLEQLWLEILHWESTPADRARVVHDYTVAAAAAALAIARNRHGPKVAIYQRLIGAVLPDVRNDFSEALAQRARPTS